MPNVYTLPGKPGAPVALKAARRTFSKPEMARLVLTGTAATLCAMLLLWLLIARMVGPVVQSSAIVAGTLGWPSAVEREPVFASEDTRLFGGQARRGQTTASSRRDFTRSVETLMDGKSRSPIVVYLSAVGGSTPNDADGDRAFLFGPGSSSFPRATLVPATEVLKLLKAKPSIPKLLILDAGQIGSDRNLGVFGNGFLIQLKALLDRDANLVVLASCAPGQISWTSETERRSAFAHYVAEGLTGRAARWGRVTVQSLFQYVQAGVSHWAERNRGAVQTPLLLGNDRLDFTLPTLTEVPRPADLPASAEAFREDLLKEWAERERLAASAPYRHAPLPWRLYQDGLLRAERLSRAGRIDEAELALGQAREFGTEVKLLLNGPTLAHPRSLAMLTRASRSPAEDAKTLDAQRERYLKAINQVIDDPGTDSSTSANPSDPSKNQATDEAKPKDDSKGDAAAKDAPKDQAKTKANAKTKSNDQAGTPAKGSKPAVDGAADLNPLDLLAQDSLHTLPIYVEGQLPLWYAAFVRAGGETDALKLARRALLHKAIEVRLKAETVAAFNPMLVRWVQPLVDQGDELRRRAQDLLFASEDGPFQDAERDLNKASDVYDQALRAAQRRGKALDLLQKLQDVLPYYGDWMAHRGDEVDEPFNRLLDRAAELALLVYDPPGKTESEAADQALKLNELADDLTKQIDRLAHDARVEVQRSATKTSSAGWREVDALLRMPMVPAKDRAPLLERAGSPDLTSPFETNVSALDEPSDTEPDPLVWNQALVLARVEVALLGIAGQDVASLGDLVKKARATRGKDPAQAFDTLDRFSARVRAIRDDLSRTNGEESGMTDRTEDQIQQTLSAASRLARILGSADIEELRRNSDPCRRLDEFDLHALLLWQGRRLNQDFAPRHAEQLLVDAQGWMSSKTLKDAFAEVQNGRDAAITIKPLEGDAATLKRKEQLRVQIETRGDVPPGLAAVVFAHDPAVPLLVSRVSAEQEPLVTVPLPKGPPLVRDFFVEHQVALRVSPEVFYRGREFSAPVSREIGAPRDLVSVEIRQRVTQFKLRGKTYQIPDQFVLNQGKGYLHPRNNLDYKLVVHNKTTEPLNVCVAHSLPGQRPTVKTLNLQGNETDETVVGTVYPLDLPDDKAKDLTVSITEGNPDGPPLCPPLKVEFRKVDPREFISAMDGYNGRVFFVCVTHEGGSDPVPLPAEVRVKVEPANGFRELKPAVGFVDRGAMRVFPFQILPGQQIDEIKWTVDAEGVSKVVEGTFLMNNVPKPPPAPPAALPKL
ncbi:MAG: caspase family protein [Isosphaeraceae bacterium]